jgi:tetratricopeptide (TPR) repeat protein
MALFFIPSTAIYSSISMEPCAVVINKKDITVQAYLKQGRYFLENGNYVKAKAKLQQVLNIDSNNSEAQALMARCNEYFEALISKERDVYNKVCDEGTVSALKSFIINYPSSSFVPQAKDRIADYNLWNEVKQTNTIDAYQKYLSASVNKCFKDDAQKAILKIKSEEEWAVCSTSTNISDLESYIKKYPDSKFRTEADLHLNELKGEYYYNYGSFEYSKYYFETAKSIGPISDKYIAHYNEVKQKVEYDSIMQSDDYASVVNYLNSLSKTNSNYNAVSNKVAIIKANSLTAYSTDDDYNSARSYAKDNVTLKQVNERIEKVKFEKRTIRRQELVQAHKMWWKRNLHVGWNLTYDMSKDLLSLSVMSGVNFRLGTSIDLFNINFGVDYAYFAYFNKHEYDDDETEDRTITDYIETMEHQIVIPIGIKLNILKVSKTCRLYVGITGEAGFKIADKDEWKDYLNDRTLAFEPQIGFNSKHIDWGIYYKKYINKYEILKNKYVKSIKNDRFGMLLTIFF